MGEVDISVVIPAFNAGPFLCATLHSVLTQEVPLEIILVDDGSTDNTVSVARTFGERVRLVEGLHHGAQVARNTGLALGRGRFVKFLDADDILLPGSLRRQLRAAQSLDQRSIPYGPARAMDADGTVGVVLPHTPPHSGLHRIAHILYFSPLTACPLHRRGLLQEIGGMDESLPREHENDLHIRLVLNGARFVYDPEPVYAYRRHQGHGGLMSGGFARFGASWMLDYLGVQEKRVRKHFGGEVPANVLRNLARLYWKSGRAVLREGHDVEARMYFREARRVFPSDPVCGRRLYRVFNRIAGPVNAERWLGAARMISKPVSGIS